MPTVQNIEPIAAHLKDDASYAGFGSALAPVAARRQLRVSLGLAGVFAIVALGVATAATFDGASRVQQEHAQYKASRNIDATFAGSLPVIR